MGNSFLGDLTRISIAVKKGNKRRVALAVSFLLLIWLLLIITTNISTSAVTQDYTFVRKWGTFGTGSGNFDLPAAVDIDSKNHDTVYVADDFGNRVQKFTTTGNFILQLGTGAKGSADGQFNHPAGVAVDPRTSDVYVADSGSLGDSNDRIQKFDRNGHFILKWGSSGSSNGQFNNPNDVAVDSKGDVYVSDLNNHRIQKFKSNGVFIKKWGQLGAGDGEFNHPAGIDVDSLDNLYVADVNNQRIQKFASNGNFITKWGTGGSGDGQFSSAPGLSLDSSDKVYVADFFNNRVQKFASNGNFITKWGTGGSGDGQFNLPAGLAIDSRGEVYVADRHNHRLQVFALQQSCPTEGSEVIEKPEPKAAGFLHDRTNLTKAWIHTTEDTETKC